VTGKQGPRRHRSRGVEFNRCQSGGQWKRAQDPSGSYAAPSAYLAYDARLDLRGEYVQEPADLIDA